MWKNSENITISFVIIIHSNYTTVGKKLANSLFNLCISTKKIFYGNDFFNVSKRMVLTQESPMGQLMPNFVFL